MPCFQTTVDSLRQDARDYLWICLCLLLKFILGIFFNFILLLGSYYFPAFQNGVWDSNKDSDRETDYFFVSYFQTITKKPGHQPGEILDSLYCGFDS